jgi:UbiD family decarboxylase
LHHHSSFLALGKDVREWIQKVEEMGELKIVQNADWNLEIGALSVLSSKHKENTPALLFDRIKDYPAGDRILVGFFESLRRSAHRCMPAFADVCRPFEWMVNFRPAAEIDAEYQKI